MYQIKSKYFFCQNHKYPVIEGNHFQVFEIVKGDITLLTSVTPNSELEYGATN